MGLLKNLRKRGLNDVLSPWKWGVFQTYLKQKIEGGIFIPYEEVHSFCEQVVYRNDLCKGCLALGECEHCGCLMPQATFVKENKCSANRWNEMQEPNVWQQTKAIGKFRIGIIPIEDAK